MKSLTKSIINEYESIIKALLVRRRHFIELHDKALLDELDIDTLKSALRNSIDELEILSRELKKLLAYIERGIMSESRLEVEE